MIKQVLASMSYDVVAEIALIMFFLVFVVVSIHTLLRSSAAIKSEADLPFDEGEQG